MSVTATATVPPASDDSVSGSAEAPERERRRWRPDRTSIWLTLAAWAPSLVWFAALRPGLMSGDSLSEWQQATGGHWVDLHPPVYTAAMWVSDRLGGGPSLLTVSQSLLLAAAVVAVARAMVRLGGRPWAVATCAAVVVVSPMYGAFSISLWKDIPYTAAFLFVSARLLDVVRARLAGDPGAATHDWWAMAAWVAVLTAFRQNGFVFVVGLVAIVAFPLRAEWRRLALLVGTSILTLVLLKAVVYPVLGVAGSGSQPAVALFLHDIAAVGTLDPAAIGPSDRALMATVAPPSVWYEAYRRFGCSSANWEFDPRLHWSAVDGHAGQFVALWLRLVRADPHVVVSNRLCVGAVAFRPAGVGVLYTVSRGVDPNPFGLRTVPIVGTLHDEAETVLDAIDHPGAQLLLWRAPLWIYAAIGACLITARRLRRWTPLLIVAPLVAMQLAVFAANPAQDARYMFGALVLAVVVLPVLTVPAKAATVPATASEPPAVP
jgi:hypothetical protein